MKRSQLGSGRQGRGSSFPRSRPSDIMRLMPAHITVVAEADLADLIPLVRSYLDFYEASPADDPLIAPGEGPPDEALLALSRALIADPEREGVQFIARSDAGEPIGFATVFWTWSTTSGVRIGVMNDLFVTAAARGTGAADALIAACRERTRGHGGSYLSWTTAHDNSRAQAVYDRVGATRDERWIDYGQEV